MSRDFLVSARARLRAGLVLPVVLLAGCVTSGYSYREDRGGGYYHGSPSVEYRYVTPYPYGAYDPYGYGYGPYGSYRYYYGPHGAYRYAHPGPYGYRYHGYGPYYGPYGYPYRYVPRRIDRTPDRPRSPWRDLDTLRRRERTQLPTVMPPSPPRTVTPVTPPSGSGMSERLRRMRERASGGKGTP